MKNKEKVLQKLDQIRQINGVPMERDLWTDTQEGYLTAHRDIMEELLTDVINIIRKEEVEF